jgi:outer membrane receptor protein involved in Fe transport
MSRSALSKALRSSCAAALIVGCSARASAQTAPNQPVAATGGQQTDASAPAGVGEIIVTAQKRAQRLNDVGISIAAASGAQLKSAGVTDVVQLAKVVPGFSVARSNYGFPVFSLRGVNLNLPYISAQPAVSVYVDQALLPYGAMTQGIFLDVERVEVLKGPQGTLFGANTTGGLINVIAAKPTSETMAGLRTEVNNFGQVDLEGYVSGSLSSNLTARLSASTSQFGAWQKCNFGCTKKNGDADRGGARLLLDWHPTERLKISTNVNGNFDHGEPQLYRLYAINIQVPGAAIPGLATYPIPPKNNRYADADQGFQPRSHDRTYQAVLRGDLELNDHLTLTSITNYANTRRSQKIDQDGTSLMNSTVDGFGRIRTFNQEGRIQGEVPDLKLRYTVGASYQHDRLLDGIAGDFFAYSGFPPNVQLLANLPVRYQSTGVFGNVEWEFAKGLTLIGGLRQAWLKEGVNGCLADGGNGVAAGLFNFISDNFIRAPVGLPPTTGFFNPGGCLTLDDLGTPATNPNFGLPYTANLRQSEHNLSWKGGINYKPSKDTLLYASVSRGYKAGGFATGFNTNASQFVSIKQEQLTSYEVGVKGSFFNHLLDLSVAAFYYDYRNKQFLTYSPSVIGIVQSLRNIPKSSVKGLEGDVTLAPLQGLTLHAAVTYLSTRVGSFSATTITGALAQLKGTKFNLAPDWSSTFDATYRFPSNGDLTPYVGLSGVYNSSAFADLGEPSALKLQSRTVLDARLGVESRKGWTATVWVRNLTDKFYVNSIFPGSDTLMANTGLPRTFGGTLALSFK